MFNAQYRAERGTPRGKLRRANRPATTQNESGRKVTAAPQGGGNSNRTEAKTPAEGRRVWLKNRHASNSEGWLALRGLVSRIVLCEGGDDNV